MSLGRYGSASQKHGQMYGAGGHGSTKKEDSAYARKASSAAAEASAWGGSMEDEEPSQPSESRRKSVKEILEGHANEAADLLGETVSDRTRGVCVAVELVKKDKKAGVNKHRKMIVAYNEPNARTSRTAAAACTFIAS